MTVTVLMFAHARDLAGGTDLKLDLADNATICDVREALVNACPELRILMPHCLFSVDQQYAEDDDRVTAQSEIGCIPPVSGG